MDKTQKDFLIESQELYEQLGRSGLTIVDCRGGIDYGNGHIPGAVSLPANALQDPQSERGSLLPIEEIACKIADVGINNHDTLVLYDDSGLVPSARLFWVLEMLGRSNVKLLNGGIPGWTGRKYPLEKEAPAVQPADFRYELNPSVLSDRDKVLQALDSQNTAIVDARTPGEYSGATETAARNGHIPGAVHINWENHIRDLFDPTFRPLDELRNLYESQGVTPDKNVIVYCRSGARSSSSYFVLRLLGFEHVSNYAGSWLEWGNDPSVPIEAAT